MHIDVAPPDLRSSLLQLLTTGELRGAACSAQCTTEFTDQSFMVTTTADLLPAEGLRVRRLPPGTSIAGLVQDHLRSIETVLLERHPLKLIIQTSSGEVEAACQRMRLRASRAARPITVESLRNQGVPRRLAALIAGDFAAA